MADDKVLEQKASTDSRFDGAENDPDNLLVVKNLKKYFPIKSSFFRVTVGNVKAVDDVSFIVKNLTTALHYMKEEQIIDFLLIILFYFYLFLVFL